MGVHYNVLGVDCQQPIAINFMDQMDNCMSNGAKVLNKTTLRLIFPNLNGVVIILCPLSVVAQLLWSFICLL